MRLLNNNLTHAASARRDLEDLQGLDPSAEVLTGQRDFTGSVVLGEGSAVPYSRFIIAVIATECWKSRPEAPVHSNSLKMSHWNIIIIWNYLDYFRHTGGLLGGN